MKEKAKRMIVRVPRNRETSILKDATNTNKTIIVYFSSLF